MLTSSANIVREVEAFYHRYINAFNEGDIERYADCFSIPYAFLRGTGMAICHDETEMKELCLQTLKGLRLRGWHRSVVRDLQVWPLEDDHVMVMADVARLKADGSVLEHGRFCYTVRYDGRNWRILTIFPVAEPYQGPGCPPRS